MADVIEDIKQRLDIVEVVSQYVELKKAGRNYKGLCPFHDEKTPSFVVSPEKQIAHCFGCGKGGDVFGFVKEMEGISFREAMDVLAERAGVKIDKEKFKPKIPQDKKDLYFESQELATEFFEEQLWQTEDGKKVLQYLENRGVDHATIKEFRLGFAPSNSDSLYQFLFKQGIPKKILIDTGLVTQKGIGEDKIYDKYRTRLIFPIFNNYGKICGFGGRALKKDQMPKYLNSPDSPIYNKSRVLYGFSHAKTEIKKKDQIVLVEGYFDVILPHQIGVKNVIATSGTALTIDQSRFLKRFTRNAITFFDNDQAGLEATKRAFQVLTSQDFIVKTASGIDGKDGAEFISNALKEMKKEDIEKIREEFLEFFQTAEEFLIFYTKKLKSHFDYQSLEGRRNVLDEIIPFLKELSVADCDYFVRKLAPILEINQKSLYEEINLFKLDVSHPWRREKQTEKQKKVTTEDYLLAMVLEYPDLFGKFHKDLEDIFDDKTNYNDIYKDLCDQYNSSDFSGKAWDFEKDLYRNHEIDFLRLYVEEKNSTLSADRLEADFKETVKRLAIENHKERLKDLQEKIRKSEQEKDQETKNFLLEKFNSLLQDGKNQ